MRKGKRIFRALCWAHFLLEEVTVNRATSKTLNFDGWMANLYGRKFAESLELSTFSESQEEARTGDWMEKVRRKIYPQMGRESHPERFWESDWDGLWRMVCFDLPRSAHRDRKILSRALRSFRFGNIQGSLFISPHDFEPLIELLKLNNVSVRGLIFSEGRLIQTASDRDVVEQTWPWAVLNSEYDFITGALERKEKEIRSQATLTEEQVVDLVQWSFETWSRASESDPFLPKVLLPGSYRGKRAYSRYARFRKTLKSRLKDL